MEKQLTNTSSTRTPWIDTARGYGIILVIIGHILTRDTAWERGIMNEIYSFHMPLFFIMSGYLLHLSKYSFREFIGKRAKSLLIPYLWLGAIIITLNWFFFDFGNFPALLGYIIELLLQNRFHVIWYLLCLFIVEVLLYGIVKLTKDNMLWTGIVCIIIAGIGLIYYQLGGTELPWNLDICPMALFFLFVGYACRQIQWRWDTYFLVIAICLNVGCVLGNQVLAGENLEMFHMQYGFLPFTLGAALSGVYTVFWIAQKKQWKSITYIGRHSMLYFGLHQAMTLAGCEMLFDAMGWLPDRSEFGQGMLYCVIVLLVTLGFFTGVQRMVDRIRAEKP